MIQRGQHVRIGIIDEALAPQDAHSCINHIQNDGGAAWGSPRAPRAQTPLTDHGHAVSALLGSRASSARGYAGVAPDAEIFFAAAGTDDSPKLSRQRLVACIAYLAEERQCDIVSVSAGDSHNPLDDINNAVESAADRGTLCFFAAGNDRVPRYPAVYPGCLAVAALGKQGMAPSGSQIEIVEQQELEPIGEGVSLWSRSARGSAIEFCAPGVGVIWSRGGLAARASLGTSFACPIAAGVAAILLAADKNYQQTPRDRSRFERALKVLDDACTPLGAASELIYWKYGRLLIS